MGYPYSNNLKYDSNLQKPMIHIYFFEQSHVM